MADSKEKTAVCFGFLFLACLSSGCLAMSTTDITPCSGNISYYKSVVSYKTVSQIARTQVRCWWWSTCTKYRIVQRAKMFTSYVLGFKRCNSTPETPTFTSPSTSQDFPDVVDVTSGAEMSLVEEPSPGQIAGVVVGSLFAIILIAVLLIFLLRRRRRQKEQRQTRKHRRQSPDTQDTFGAGSRTNHCYSLAEASGRGQFNQSEGNTFELANQDSTDYSQSEDNRFQLQQVNKTDQSETFYDNLSRENDKTMHENLDSNAYDHTVIKPNSAGICEGTFAAAECSTTPDTQYDHLDQPCAIGHGKSNHVMTGYDQVTLQGT